MISYEDLNLTDEQLSIISKAGLSKEQIVNMINKAIEVYKQIRKLIKHIYEEIKKIFSELSIKFIIRQRDNNKIVLLPRPQKYLNTYKPVIIKSIKRLDKLYTRGNRKRGYEKI